MSRAVLGLAFVLTLALIVVGWWASPPEPVRVLRRHWSPLARVERDPAPELGARVERWRMITASGDTVRGLWRAAGTGAPRPWTAVLLGGLVTGDRAALLIPDDTPVHVLAVDWPWAGSRRLPPLEILIRLGAIQHAALRSPAALALGVEAVAGQPEVEPSRVLVLGASLGVPPAIAALRLTHVPRALVLLDGGADIAAMLDAALRGAGWPEVPAHAVAALAFRLVRPLEPSLHAGAAAGLRVLILNSENDRLVPRPSAERLRAILPGAEMRWRPGDHVDPGHRNRLAATAHEVEAWLADAAREAGRVAPGR